MPSATRTPTTRGKRPRNMERPSWKKIRVSLHGAQTPPPSLVQQLLHRRWTSQQP